MKNTSSFMGCWTNSYICQLCLCNVSWLKQNNKDGQRMIFSLTILLSTTMSEENIQTIFNMWMNSYDMY